MGRHILFLFIYLICSQAFPGEVICGVLIFHCLTSILVDLKDLKSSVTLILIYNVGVMIATFANLIFIQKVKEFGTSEDVLHIYNYIDERYIDDASLLWALGNAFIFIGYELVKKRSLPPIDVIVSDKKALDNIFYFTIGMMLLNVTGNGINLSFIAGGFEKILQLFGIVGILFYGRLWVTENSRRFGIYAIILTVVDTILALQHSYIRIDLILPSATLFLGYFIGKGEIKALFSYRIIPVLVVFGVFSAFFQSLGGARAHFITAFEAPVQDENSGGITYTEKEEEKSGSALERSADVAQMTNVIRLTKENGFYDGRASLPLVAALVPRIFWPDKPTVQLGAWFAVEIGVASVGESGRANNSVNMSIPGELYLDFGYTGVVIGCVLFGIFLALIWNASRFNESQYNLTGTLWGGYLLQCAIGTMGSDLQVAVTLLSTYLVFLMMKKFADQYANTQHGPSVEGQ